MYRLFPVFLVALTFLLDDVLWYAQSNPSIDVPPMSSLISLGIFLERVDFVVKKSRRFCPCVSEQGLSLGEFELEFLLQEHAKLLLDFFCFCFGTDEAEAKIIGVPYVPEPPEILIAGVNRGHLLGLFRPQPGGLLVALLSLAIGTVQEHVVLFAPTSLLSFGVCWNELFFHEFVQFVQVQIGKDG